MSIRRSRSAAGLARRSARVVTLAAIAAAVSLGGRSPRVASADTPSAAPPGYVRIDRGAHPLARPELDAGRLDPGRRIANLSLVFKLSPAQLRDREALKAAQLDPSSPSYHRWLTPEEYAARFGARPDAIARASAWLMRQGLEVRPVSRLGTRVTFSGRVSMLESAFHTEMHAYVVNGEAHYAMATAPAIPAELADVVLGIHNTHDFYARPLVHASGSSGPEPAYHDPQSGYGLAPADWATVYDVTPLYTTGVAGTPIDGTGVTIAVVGVAEVSQSDVNAFRTRFGLPASTLTMTLVPNTGASTAGTQGSGIEAFLDVEWSGGLAKGATIDFVYTGADDQNVDDATYYAIENDLAPIISESFAGCELGETPSDQDFLEIYGSAANLLGITYVAGSGDSGAAGCLPAGPYPGLYVSMPASYPGVTAVGGTQFPTGSIKYDTSGNATGYSTEEAVWDESNNPSSPEGVGSAGGGISAVFSRPSYQSAIPTCSFVGSLPPGVTASTMREVPDISLTAASAYNPYFIECSYSQSTGDCLATGGSPQVFGIGGTSAATPSFAALVALLNQATGERLGNVNPLLYALESSAPAAFHDIVLGNNDVLCTAGTDQGCSAGGNYGFAAAAGYDCGSGIGSIDAYNLVSAWATLTPTTTTIAASPTSTTEGANVALSATVDVTGSNANALGGTVTYTFESYLASGQLDLSWVLGAAPITGGTTTGGSSALAPAPIPPGLVNPAAQYVDVVAMYGGDAYHLASTSAKVRITFGAIDFAVTPASSAVAPGGAVQFTATGGVAPISWGIESDTTCDSNFNCSNIDSTSGAFTAGPLPGAVVVVAADNDTAEAFANVTVASPNDGGTEAGTTDAASSDSASGTDGATSHDSGVEASAMDSGSMPAMDSEAPVDGAAEDGPGAEGSGAHSSGGCACNAGGGAPPSGMLAGVALGLGLVVRRRRRRAA